MTALFSANNIVEVVTGGLCAGCGFCAGCCPQTAVKMELNSQGFFVPTVVEKACLHCGICLGVCPSVEPGLNKPSNNPAEAFCSRLLGPCIGVYIGNATNYDVRQLASSGGVVTALIIHLLQRKIVDGAIVVTMDDENPLNAKATIATSKKEVINGSGSKYTPVSMHQVVKQLLSDDKKYVFVGLPCHLTALSHMEKIFKNLGDRIVLKIGLYCNNSPSANATRYILKKYKVPSYAVVGLTYRGHGSWPGYMTITLKDRRIKIKMTDYWDSGFGQYFCPKRCVLCADQTAELSDISVADPWTLFSKLSETQGGRAGKSLLIARNFKAEKILTAAIQADVIALNSLKLEKAVQSATTLKKRNKHSSSVKFLLGVKYLPCQNYSLPLNFGTVVWIMCYRLNSFFAKNAKTWFLLNASVKACSTVMSMSVSLKKLKSLIFVKIAR
jgi:coenzyme F420 hydrogenase subunit beta